MNPGLQKALFLHTQKTAGSSIVQLASDQYGYRNVIMHDDYLGVDASRIDQAPFISGHFGFEFAKKRMAGRYSFTFLRDPIERLLSLYSFCRARHTDDYNTYALARQLDLEQFLLAEKSMPMEYQVSYREMIWNHQTWQLCFGWSEDVRKAGRVSIVDFCDEMLVEKAASNLLEFDYVGFAETFDHDVACIAANLGMSLVAPPPKINVSENRIRLTDLPESTIKLLHDLTELDRRIYDIAWARRQQAKIGTNAE